MSVKAMMGPLLAATMVLCGLQAAAKAADGPEEAINTAREEFKATLDKVGNLFYKQVETESGMKYLVIMWEMEGETSKISVEFRHLGDVSGKPVIGILAYTVVAESDGSFPPAIIKAVATKNETTGLGAFSMSDGFDIVFLNQSMPCETMTPEQAWIVFAFMHQNRTRFRSEMKPLLEASGR